jgi:hypothetical protein
MTAKPSGMRRVFNTESSMRPSLHILSERRRHQPPARRTSGPARGRSERAADERRPADGGEAANAVSRPVLRRRVDQTRLDVDAQRVRESGGPLDQAQYSCSCGYVFDAAVSTTVACPHCGDSQAW